MEKIVNIHIPKTGGTSFREALSQHYEVITDYGHRIGREVGELIRECSEFNSTLDVRDYASIHCISGHILPLKYAKLHQSGWKFITWLREPAQRLYSNYHHHLRNAENPVPEVRRSPLAQRILDDKLSVEEFVFDPICKNVCQRFFHGFPPENYFFIGITENYESDLRRLSDLLGLDMTVQKLNTNPDKPQPWYPIDASLLDQIKAFHREDYALYERVVAQTR